MLAVLVGGVVWATLPRSGPMQIEHNQAAAQRPAESPADRDSVEENARTFDTKRAAAQNGSWVLSPAPVVPRGRLEAWDDFKVDSPSLVVEQNGGLLSRGTTRYRLWYRGCHLLGVDYSCGVGYAESPDEVRWTKAPAPVFSPTDRSDREHLGAVSVVHSPSQYHMWYAVDPDWPAGRTHGTLHHATSEDGTSWHDEGTVLQTLDEDMSHHLSAEVLFDGGTYQMWYTDRVASDGNRMVVHATSADGRVWAVAGSTPLTPFGDQDPGRLSVTGAPGGYRAWFAYNAKRQARGRVLGSCTSTDGSTWSECGPIRDFALPGYGALVPTAPTVRSSPDAVWLLYGQRPANGGEEISLAFRKGTL